MENIMNFILCSLVIVFIPLCFLIRNCYKKQLSSDKKRQDYFIEQSNETLVQAVISIIGFIAYAIAGFIRNKYDLLYDDTLPLAIFAMMLSSSWNLFKSNKNQKIACDSFPKKVNPKQKEKRKSKLDDVRNKWNYCTIATVLVGIYGFALTIFSLCIDGNVPYQWIPTINFFMVTLSMVVLACSIGINEVSAAYKNDINLGIN